MAKDYWKLNDKLSRKKWKFLNLDIITRKISCWTYADMKREFQRSMEIFSENGFPDESAELAWRSVKLSRWTSDGDMADATTENAMAAAVFFNKAFETNEVRSICRWKHLFCKWIDKYRSTPAHGLVLSPEEQSELDRDIKHVLDRLCSSDIKIPLENSDVLKYTELDIDNEYGSWEKIDISSPPADSDERMRERLSERAYAMVTEYERDNRTADLDVLEKKCLLPNGLKLTDKLRDFIEIYDGRVFAWRDTTFRVDWPLSLDSFKGFNIRFSLEAPILVSGDEYYINAMEWLVAGDWGPYIGSDGKIYYYRSGFPMLAANSMEEFLEEQAREYYKDQLLLERRCELENKYLIPEIRTASM